MHNIMVKSYLFLLGGGFKELPIDLKHFKEELDRNNLELLSYQEGAVIIQKLGLEEYAQTKKGFTFLNNRLKIIFYKDDLPYGEKLFVIAHEIAHFALNHSPVGIKGKSESDITLTVQEQEADAFAYNLLAPLCVLVKLKLNTVSEIKKITLLDDVYAKKVLHSLKAAQKHQSQITKTEQQLLKQFEEFIQDYTGRNMKKKTRPGLWILCFLLLFFLLTGTEMIWNDSNDQPVLSQQTVPATLSGQSASPPNEIPDQTAQPTKPRQEKAPARQDTTNKLAPQTIPPKVLDEAVPAIEKEPGKEPTITPMPTPKQTPEPEIVVYVTKSGEKYHTKDCKYIKNHTAIEIPLFKAIKLYEPCKSCNPPH